VLVCVRACAGKLCACLCATQANTVFVSYTVFVS